ncbi:hypothetical protein SRIMM317S_04641 [Streptomyces rimosus subsp. rimosus]
MSGTATETGRQAGAAAADREALLAAALEPTAEWLESIFGVGALWRPTEGELPERLEHAETRTFLTEVGFPSVHLGFVDYDSTDLAQEGPWAETRTNCSATATRTTTPRRSRTPTAWASR